MRPLRSVAPFVLAALVALGPAFPTPAAHAFDMPRHSRMTEQAMDRLGVTGAAQGLIAWGAMLPDLQDCVGHCYCAFWPFTHCNPDSAAAIPYSVDHFDNNLLYESAWNVEDNMAIAMSGITPTPTGARAAARALIAFGRALHTTQDFYAHSTFLEINLPLLRGNPMNLPRWQGGPYALFAWTTSDGLTGGGGLETGYYLQGGPFGSYTHDLLNKDNPNAGLVPSHHGAAHVNISVPASMQTTLYGLVSGDLRGDGAYTEYGLAPRHTAFAYDILLHGGLVFPGAFAKAERAPVAPAGAQQVQSFFDWVNANPECIAMAQTADTLIARAERDSLYDLPLSLVDAEGLPVPFPVGVGEPPMPGPSRLAITGPNPFATSTTLRFLAPAGGRVRLAVLDPGGRRVATLLDADAPAGFHDVRWDGRDDAGRPAAPGVYLVRFDGFGRTESRRLVLAR